MNLHRVPQFIQGNLDFLEGNGSLEQVFHIRESTFSLNPRNQRAKVTEIHLDDSRQERQQSRKHLRSLSDSRVSSLQT